MRLPGPISMNVSTPPDAMFRTVFSHSTGLQIWAESRPAASAP